LTTPFRRCKRCRHGHIWDTRDAKPLGTREKAGRLLNDAVRLWDLPIETCPWHAKKHVHHEPAACPWHS
jgi:hypothetical protein